MRNLEPGLADLPVAVQQQVQVDRARPEPRPAPRAAETPLDREQPVEEFACGQAGLDGGGRVQEARLLGEPDRRRVAEGRDADDLDARLGRELLERRSQHGLAIAEVRPQADERPGHRPGDRRSAVAADHSAAMPAGRGFRTRTRTAETSSRSTSASATAAESDSIRSNDLESDTCWTQSATSR